MPCFSCFLLYTGFTTCWTCYFVNITENIPPGFASHPEWIKKDDILDLYGRLFNHRPFLKGEISQFVKEFENKRGDREVENVFAVLEKTTELHAGQVDKLADLCDSTLPNLNANLLVAQSMCNKILEQARCSDFDQALESSRQAREKDWSGFMSDVQDKCERIDDAYKQKEQDIRAHYGQLDSQLVTKQ